MALGFLEFCICLQYNQGRTTQASLPLLQRQLPGRTLLSSKTQKKVTVSSWIYYSPGITE